MQDKDIKKTTFWMHEDHFEFLVIWFDLSNTLNTFQSLMNEIFFHQLQKFILVFSNDIFVYNKDWDSVRIETHLEQLRMMQSILRDNHLFINSIILVKIN